MDASHHQGEIDWARVRRDRISFAYLEATEGSTFIDPRFVGNARVRSIGSTPPAREWWIWQMDDRATVDGISGPADLNLMAP